MILHNLTTRTRESEAFSNFESESDSEHSVQSNYRSNHETPDNPVDDSSEHTPPPEADTTLPTPPDHEANQYQRSEENAESISTPPPDQQSGNTNDSVPTPPLNTQVENEEAVLPFADDTMPYPYMKYWDEPDVEAHVYAFLQTWEANHVSHWFTEAEVERSKIEEFWMTLEVSAVEWHKKHLPGSFAKFEVL